MLLSNSENLKHLKCFRNAEWVLANNYYKDQDKRTNLLLVFPDFLRFNCFLVMLIHQNSCQHNLDQTRFVFYVFGNDDMALLFFNEQFEITGKPINQLVYTNHFLKQFSHLGNLLENFMSHSSVCVPFGILNDLFTQWTCSNRWVSHLPVCVHHLENLITRSANL